MKFGDNQSLSTIDGASMMLLTSDPPHKHNVYASAPTFFLADVFNFFCAFLLCNVGVDEGPALAISTASAS